jgi:hypothetical protein
VAWRRERVTQLVRDLSYLTDEIIDVVRKFSDPTK